MTRPTALALVCLLVLGIGCTKASSNGVTSITGVEGRRVPVANLRAAMTGLCNARDRATLDPAAAKAIFFDESHDRLHDIAAALERIDRSASSDLLVAKQRIEADVTSPTPSPSLSSDLDRLATRTQESLTRLGVTSVPCPPTS